MKKYHKILIVSILTLCIFVNTTYQRPIHAEASATVTAFSVAVLVLTALGVSVAIPDATQLSVEQKAQFVTGVCSTLNSRSAGLGDDFNNYIQDVVRLGVASSLTVAKTLWDRLRNATANTEAGGFTFEDTTPHPTLSGDDVYNIAVLYGCNNNSQNFHNYCNSVASTYNEYGNLMIAYVGNEYWKAVVAYRTRSTISNGSRTYYNTYGAKWHVSQAMQDYVSGNISISETSVIKVVIENFNSIESEELTGYGEYQDTRVTGKYDIATRGRTYDSQTKEMEGDVVITVPATSAEEIAQGISDRTLTVPAVQAQEGVRAVDIDEGKVIGKTQTIPEAIESIETAADVVVGDYEIDLSSFFPFCIPFDIYDFLSLFEADPVAPSMTWKFPYVTSNGVAYVEQEINLSQFDNVASLVRRLELIAFIVGLAFVTRSMFIRS